MLTWLVIGSNGYCGQLPEKRELRTGMGKPRTQFPPSGQGGQGGSGAKPRVPGAPTAASAAAIETPGVHAELK